MKTMPKVKEHYRAGEFDTHLMTNGDLIDLRLSPFRGTEVTHVDIVASMDNTAVNGRAVVERQLTVIDGKLAGEFTVTLEMDSRHQQKQFQTSDKQWHRPNKRTIFRWVLALMYEQTE